MDDERTHRRRSSSSVLAAGGKHYRQSSIPLTNGHSTVPGGKAIPEESDGGLSSSDVEMDDICSDDDLTDDEETGLTHAERRKRRRRKRRHTQLDERIAGGESTAELEEKLATASLLRTNIVNALLILLWYSFSISISVYNKWMFSKENLDFHFPLFTTSLHMVVQFSLASAVLFFLPGFRPGAGAGVAADPHSQGYAQVDGNEEREGGDAVQHQPVKPTGGMMGLMTKWFYFTRIGPCGTATALDIGLGNFSLRFISLTFFTMCKSSVLAFVLVFAFLFKLESPSWRLGIIILFMTAGVIMMVAGETAFNALGFILVMTASFCSGFRWSLTQILLLRNPATSNPFSTLFFLTPIMFLSLFVLALPIEGPSNVAEGFRTLAQAKGVILGVLIMLFPGVLAFLMVSAEFALLQRTSVVTLSVCGIFKEVLTISAAGAIFGDELSPINVSGLVVTIASIAAYNYLKYSKMRRDAHKQAQQIIEERADVSERGGKASQRFSEDDSGMLNGTGGGDDSRRGMMRDSLSLATGDALPAHVRVASVGQSSSQSPVKRPEDLE